MRKRRYALIAPILLTACVSEAPYDPLEDYEALDATTIMAAPEADLREASRETERLVAQGKYLVEILGCGSCHTDGALVGEPRMNRQLAGSRIGIAYTNPLEYRNPGVVFAPNITPDDATGIGLWTEQQLVDAVRVGQGRHGRRRILVMPWQGYASVRYEDAFAIARYLQSIPPVSHQVPAEVPAGRPTTETFVHFGVYRSR